MSLTYTTAPTVERGQRITSTQFATLADALNDRIKGGIADCAWRIVYYWFNLWRQVRNPAEGGWVFPTQGEFFDLYQHLDPDYHMGSTWPVTGPGEYEGANLANPMMQYVFGVSPDLDDEEVRLSNAVPWTISGPATDTLEYYWTLAKYQRGGYDPTTGGQSTPAWDAAQNFFLVSQPYWSPHGKSYGGFFPTPTILDSDCGTTASDGLGVPSYEIKFTALRSGVEYTGSLGTAAGDPVVVTYTGSCPSWTADTGAGHVEAVVKYPLAWYVVVNDGVGGFETDIFLTADWVEGPYTGQGYLAHGDGGQLQRAIHRFVTEFRGAPSQRTPDTFKIKNIAADFQAFYTAQHQLSPAYGSQVADEIIVDYPAVVFSGPLASAGFGSWSTGGTSRQIAEDFVLGGIYVKGVKLSEQATLLIYNDTTLIRTITLAPDETGFAEALVTIKDGDAYNVKVSLSEQVHFQDGTGYIRVEISELYGYKPNYFDAYLLCRMGATLGGTAIIGGVDGSGYDYGTSKQLTDDYFTYGALVNRSGVNGPRSLAEWVNDNPVFEAARRMTREHVRIVRRQNFDAVEVTGGKTILYFKRYAYGMNNVRADMFDNIAPPIDQVPSGTLENGVTYVVWTRLGTGRILYQGTHYSDAQTFTATAETEYETVGDALLYVHEGIKTEARQKGLTNEWVMFLETKCYHPSATSVWKPEAYSDYFTFNSRCQFYSGTADSEVRRHMAYNYETELDGSFNPVLNPIRLQAIMMAPEAPTGYNYVDDTNRLFGDADFYSSCRIYEKPYVIESCTVDRFGADAIVKVVLSERLRSHPDAPSTVARDVSTWDTTEKDNLGLEDYRTDDNAIREYALYNYDQNENCTFKRGDTDTIGSVTGLPDNPYGSCFPHFHFVKLIPKPYDDGNDKQEPHDTRRTVDAFQQMEVYLRAMCEGYVDGNTSMDIICASESGGLFDYTFENLCFEAFGGSSVGAFSLLAREDEPAGFGPLPNTKPYADVFNRLSSAVNLLTKARLEIPVAFENRSVQYPRTERAENFTDTDGSSGCSTSSFYAAIKDSGAPVNAVGTPSYGAWSTWTSIAASKGTGADGCPSVIFGDRLDTEYKVSIDAAFTNAVPTHVQELVTSLSTGFIANYTQNQDRFTREDTTPGNGSSCSAVADHWKISGTEQRWIAEATITSSACIVVNSGTLEAPGLLSADYGVGHSAGTPAGETCYQGGASSEAVLDLFSGTIAFVTVPLA